MRDPNPLIMDHHFIAFSKDALSRAEISQQVNDGRMLVDESIRSYQMALPDILSVLTTVDMQSQKGLACTSGERLSAWLRMSLWSGRGPPASHVPLTALPSGRESQSHGASPMQSD